MSEKSIARDKGGFGTGVPKGIAAPEAGNNSAAGSALVLTLALPKAIHQPCLGSDRELANRQCCASFDECPNGENLCQSLSVPAWVLLPGVTMVSFVRIGYAISIFHRPQPASIISLPDISIHEEAN